MRAMDTDKDSRVGFTDFETFFRQILEQSFKRLDQRGTQTLTVEEVLIITSSFQESSEPLSVAKTQECRKCLGSNDVDMQLFVDYMLIETLGGHQPEEQKRALARLLGISSSSQQQKQQKGLEDSWRDTLIRIQATAPVEFLKMHGLDVLVDQLMKQKTETQAAALYAEYIAKCSPAERTLFDILSAEFLSQNCLDPLDMNLRVGHSIIKMQSFVRKWRAKAQLRQRLLEQDTGWKQRFCHSGKPHTPGSITERKTCNGKCHIC